MTFTATPVKPPIELADLERIDVRVGTILSVEDVPGSDKLVKLTVAFGDHERTILAGMKQERENPKEIEGKQALFVVNLPPKRMTGHISEGMLFDIGYADGVRPVLAVPESAVPDGTRAADVWNRLRAQHRALAGYERPPMTAINETYVAADQVLRDGDEVAFIPPVAGG